jgi:hypothetical protein
MHLRHQCIAPDRHQRTAGPAAPSFTPHEVLASAGEAWLVHLADPERRVPAPAQPLDSTEVWGLLAAAETHGVLPAVTRALGTRLDAGSEPPGASREMTTVALERARSKVAQQTGFGLLLSHHAGKVIDALVTTGVAATLVKGAMFGSRLYPDAVLRTFTDVDVLVPEARRDDAAEAMRGLGFELFEFESRCGKDYHEQKWLLQARPDVMVEVHSNLVHSPKLRGSMCVRYEDVLEAGDGDPSAPTALLFVAAAHAAVGHQFDRLQHLVDVVQAARGAAGPVDQGRLARVAGRCGVMLAVAAALDLAGRTFHDAEVAGLARWALSGQIRRLPCLMLTPGLVLRAQSTARAQGSWRRKMFRQAMRLGVA